MISVGLIFCLDLVDLASLVLSNEVDPSREDRVLWLPYGTGVFSITSAWDLIHLRRPMVH